MATLGSKANITTAKFPVVLNRFPNPASTDLLDNASEELQHDIQHRNINDALAAIEQKLGIDDSTDTASVDYKVGRILEIISTLGHPVSEDYSFSDDFDGSVLDGKWSWVNQGSAAYSVGESRLMLSQASHAASDDIKMLVQTAPNGTWKVRAKIALEWELDAAAYPAGGICLRESGTGKIELLGINWRAGVNYLVLQRFTNPTTFSASPWANNRMPYTIYYVQIEKTASNLLFSVSLDGAYFRQVSSEALTAFFTAAPDQIGIFLNSYNCASESIASIDWIRRLT